MNSFAYAGLSLLHTLLLDAFGRTTLLLLAAWTVTRLFRRMSAARQHFVWLSALVGVVYVLAASLVLPVCNSLKLPASSATMPVTVWRYASEKRETVTPALYKQLTYSADGPAVIVSPLTSAVVSHSTGLEWTFRGIFWLKAVWLFGFLAALLRLARNQYAVRLLQRHSQPAASSTLQEILIQVATRLGVTRLPTLLTLESQNGAFSPLTWGWKPAFLLLPANVETWPQERIEAILLHELAHLRRCDWLTQRIADAICAILWFHPLVWLTAKNLRGCAERACDDVALMNGIAPERYARHLLDIAQTLRPRPLAPAATLPFLRGSQFETRVRAILDGTIPRRAFSRMGQYGILAVGALGLMPFALALPVTTQPVKYVVADAITATNDKVTLPDGVTVELLGVTDDKPSTTSHSSRWWKADGTLLNAPPYAPTVLQKLYHGRPTRLHPNLTISLKLSGADMAEANTIPFFTPFAIYLETARNSYIPHDKAYTLYEIQTRFPDNTTVATLRFKFAQKQWQTVATAARLHTIVHASDETIARFDKPDKEEAGIAKRERPGKVSEAAVIIRATNNQGIRDGARRVLLIDDQGKTILVNSFDYFFYSREQKGRMELHLLFTISDKLRGHIRQYQLQMCPYQYFDFPNIHLKPTTAVQQAP